MHRACTARTGSRPTRCSRGWCSPRAPRTTCAARSRRPPGPGRPLGRAARPASSDEAVVVTPQLGRDPPPDVELRRHRAHRPAAGARRAPDRASSARRSASTTGTSLVTATCSSCATSPSWRRPDHRVRPPPRREPRAALQPRPPRARPPPGPRHDPRPRRRPQHLAVSAPPAAMGPASSRQRTARGDGPSI